MAKDKGEDDVKPSGGGSKLVLILMLLNLVGIGGLGAYMVLFGDTGEGTAEAQEGESEGQDPEGDDPYIFGPLIEMEPLIVNMMGEGMGRFMRVTLHLELRDEEQRPQVEVAMVPVRNRLLIYFSELDADRTRVEGGKEEIREELVRVINDVIGAAMIRRVYYTEFVVQ